MYSLIARLRRCDNSGTRLYRPQDLDLIAPAFEAIAAIVPVETSGSNATRRVLDSKAFARIINMLSSETSPNVLESGLGVLISLGSRTGTLTSDELHAVAPVLAKLLL